MAALLKEVVRSIRFLERQANLCSSFHQRLKAWVSHGGPIERAFVLRILKEADKHWYDAQPSDFLLKHIGYKQVKVVNDFIRASEAKYFELVSGKKSTRTARQVIADAYSAHLEWHQFRLALFRDFQNRVVETLEERTRLVELKRVPENRDVVRLTDAINSPMNQGRSKIELAREIAETEKGAQSLTRQVRRLRSK